MNTQRTNRIISIVALLFYGFSNSYSQQIDFSKLTGKYLGQHEPGNTPELFAPEIVSTSGGVHGNIVFTSDFTEAAWHPNYLVNGKSLIYIMKYRDGKWQAPIEFFLKEGFNYSEPFYSYDGNNLYYLSGGEGSSGSAGNENIYFAERKTNGWTEPKLLSQNLPAFHWQFSFDKNSNLYYGGKSDDKKGEIFYSQFNNGEYLNPVRLPETINSSSAEFSPFISPDNTYLVFTRLMEQKNAPPQMNLFVSFRNKNGDWTEAQNLTAKIGLSVQTPVIMMSAARVTPDGKYLFFCYFNGKGHMAYWVSTQIIEELKPKE
jgi:Tol biopolymer transport system component